MWPGAAQVLLLDPSGTIANELNQFLLYKYYKEPVIVLILYYIKYCTNRVH